ncbi:hypothetical protein SK3146_06823 [Paenibacillus konkukensis]|uniref:Integrase catalytic domain-containing protein n=1 Tax=Paenibacillus konkukensis TaxID=2020716 RepID=A0ABY4S1E5_9BACL|nr:hypothetical protein SK3146_06823 [Paenibacillus konkukensis]
MFFGSKKLTEPVMKPKYIHKKFIDKCKEIGVSRNQYPFNTTHLGYKALCRYLVHLRDTHFGQSSSRYGHDAEQKAKNSGKGQLNYPQTITPYQHVEFDGHRIDGKYVIIIKTLEGDEAVLALERLWFLSFIDRATNTIIGRPHICLNKEYNASDVMIAAKKAVIPVKKKNLTIDGLSYQPTGGYPSERFPVIKWAVWDVVYFDNAKAHLAEMVRERFRNLIGCTTCLGAVDRPMRRPHIERFHQTLTSSSIQRMVNTTGSHPNDPRRDEPEKKAIQYKMTYEHLEELLDVVVSNYNGTPHGALFYNSPLDALEQRLNKGMLPRLLDESKRAEVEFTRIEQPRTIRGSHKSGKRPYIEYMGVEYRNELLAQSAHLINTKIIVHVNVDDLRTIRVYLPDGSELGELVAAGKWSLTPHTLQMRKAINLLKAKRLIHFTQWDDPIFVYHEYLLSQTKIKMGNNEVKTIKNGKIGHSRRELIQLGGFNQLRLQQYLECDLVGHNSRTLSKILKPIENFNERVDTWFPLNLRWCELCIKNGYHSWLHQFTLIQHCPFHRKWLDDTCPSCYNKIPFLLSDDMLGDPFTCRCGFQLATFSETQWKDWALTCNILDPTVINWLEREGEGVMVSTQLLFNPRSTSLHMFSQEPLITYKIQEKSATSINRWSDEFLQEISIMNNNCFILNFLEYAHTHMPMFFGNIHCLKPTISTVRL